MKMRTVNIIMYYKPFKSDAEDMFPFDLTLGINYLEHPIDCRDLMCIDSMDIIDKFIWAEQLYGFTGLIEMDVLDINLNSPEYSYMSSCVDVQNILYFDSLSSYIYMIDAGFGIAEVAGLAAYNGKLDYITYILQRVSETTCIMPHVYETILVAASKGGHKNIILHLNKMGQSITDLELLINSIKYCHPHMLDLIKSGPTLLPVDYKHLVIELNISEYNIAALQDGGALHYKDPSDCEV